MKKSLLLVFCFTLISLCAVPAQAAEQQTMFTINSPVYTINNVVQNMDVSPYIQGGRTLVPIRYVAYGLGMTEKELTYSQGTVTIKNAKTTATMTVGIPVIYVNGELRKIDAAPVIKNSRMFLPVRYVAEAFGADIDWNQQTRMVVIKSLINDASDNSASKATAPNNKSETNQRERNNNDLSNNITDNKPVIMDTVVESTTINIPLDSTTPLMDLLIAIKAPNIQTSDNGNKITVSRGKFMSGAEFVAGDNYFKVEINGNLIKVMLKTPIIKSNSGLEISKDDVVTVTGIVN